MSPVWRTHAPRRGLIRRAIGSWRSSPSREFSGRRRLRFCPCHRYNWHVWVHHRLGVARHRQQWRTSRSEPGGNAAFTIRDATAARVSRCGIATHRRPTDQLRILRCSGRRAACTFHQSSRYGCLYSFGWQAERLPYNGIRNESSVLQFAKISRHIWFEIEIPNRCATKQSSVDNRAPHDRAMNHVQRAEYRRINNNQAEHR